jgi:hypothetical protein
MAKAVEDQPEFHIAKSFFVMTVLQPARRLAAATGFF